MTFTLLTGATGLLGSFLLRDALLQGRPMAVVVRGDQPEQRLEAILGPLPQHLKVMRGDLRQSRLGLTSADQDWLRQHCNSVIHSAAVVKFESTAHSPEPFATNLEGTHNLVRLCQVCDISRFHHISTAYVCGLGPAREEFSQDSPGFRNCYERSKYFAELLVREQTWEHLCVYRPAGVLGGARDGYTPKFQGVYNLLQMACELAREGIDISEFGLTQPVNLVTADWFARTFWHLFDHGQNGKTFHLTNPEPTDLNQFYAVVRKLVPAQRQSTLRLESTELESYLPYIFEHPHFEAHPIECPRIDEAVMENLLRYALEQKFGQGHRALDSTVFESLPCCDDPAQIQVTVPDRGTWALSQSDEGVFRSPTAGPAPHFYGTFDTLSAVAAHRVSPNQALDSGRLVLFDESHSPVEATRTLLRVLGRMAKA